MSRPAADAPGNNLQRIARILLAFDAGNAPLTAAALFATARVGRSTGFGLLRALGKAGYLRRVEHGLWQLGERAAALAFSPIDRRAIQFSAREDIAGADIAVPDFAGQLRLDPNLVEFADTARFRKAAPYRLGFSNASVGNPWRRAMLGSMGYALSAHADKIARFDALDAGDDPQLQARQIDQLAGAGIDLLLVSVANSGSAAIAARLRHWASRGLPIVAIDRAPTAASPDSATQSDALTAFVTASDAFIGRVSALWLAEFLRGRGRVWILSGLQGASPAVDRQAAALGVFSEFPGITVEAVSYTGWTEQGGYDAVGDLLASGREIPHGVWCDSGLQGIGSIRRLSDAGAPIPPHTGGDLNAMYRICLRWRVPLAALDYPAVMGARAVETALDVLAGRPTLKRAEVPVKVVLPKGMETASVKADVFAESHVEWDSPGDKILSQGPALASGFGGKTEHGEDQNGGDLRQSG